MNLCSTNTATFLPASAVVSIAAPRWPIVAADAAPEGVTVADKKRRGQDRNCAAGSPSDAGARDRTATMADAPLPLESSEPSPMERLFPTLTAAQIARVEAHGHRRRTTAGEVLVEIGDRTVPFFLIVSGEVRILRVSGTTETVIVSYRSGQFLGEGNIIAGRRALMRAQVIAPGEVIELDRVQLLALVQTDAELGEILMRAFILRRAELIARGLGDVVVIGSAHCAG